MAKNRYIKDSFWTDPYVETLSPDYKLVFVYLLTNPLSNVAGVYEIRLKRMAYETGYDSEVIENILKKLSEDKKIIRLKEWIVLVNHFKHQSIGNLTAEGINRIINDSPQEIQDLFEEKVVNTEDNQYSVLVLKENISPLQAPSKSRIVRLSKVELSNSIKEKEYGEFHNVYLSDDDYKKLTEKLGEINTKILIEELSTYIASTSKGKKYINHYATLLGWARRKITQHKESKVLKTKQFIV